MGTTIEPETAAPRSERQRLLMLVAGHVLEHGVAGLTLRNLGKAIGTNNRMLLYYFESKEKLIQAALAEAGSWEPQLYGDLVDLEGEGPLPDRLRATWAGISRPANRPYIRLFFEIFGLAVHDRGKYDDFLHAVETRWVSQLRVQIEAEGVDTENATVLAQQLLAFWRGLQMLLAADGDADQICEINSRTVDAVYEEIRSVAATA